MKIDELAVMNAFMDRIESFALKLAEMQVKENERQRAFMLDLIDAGAGIQRTKVAASVRPIASNSKND